MGDDIAHPASEGVVDGQVPVYVRTHLTNGSDDVPEYPSPLPTPIGSTFRAYAQQGRQTFREEEAHTDETNMVSFLASGLDVFPRWSETVHPDMAAAAESSDHQHPFFASAFAGFPYPQTTFQI